MTQIAGNKQNMLCNIFRSTLETKTWKTTYMEDDLHGK
jgi:uncharacterized protein YcgL (UPF0745 family)